MPINTNFILIRHAEKPEDDENDTNLSQAGQARAWAFVSYFQNFKVGPNVIRFNHLFATAESTRSNRPYLTLEPLSQQLGLTINNLYENKPDDIKALANYLLLDPGFNNSNILICWHHGQLEKLARHLCKDEDFASRTWPEDEFGRLLRITFDASGLPSEKEVTQQKLMYTDKEG